VCHQCHHQYHHSICFVDVKNDCKFITSYSSFVCLFCMLQLNLDIIVDIYIYIFHNMHHAR